MVTFVEMFLSWVVSLSGLSFCLTRGLSSYKLKKLEVTVGQIVPLMCEITIAIWALTNIANYNSTIWHLLTFSIGFYTYDMLHMLTYEEGRKSYIYYLHHIATISMLGYLINYPDLTANVSSPLIVFLLESSSASVNITALYKQFVNINIQRAELINIIIYGITRILAYPITISYSLYILYIDENINNYTYIFPITVLYMLYGVCVFWFRSMALKYYKKYYSVPPTSTESTTEITATPTEPTTDITSPTHNLLS